MFESRKIKKAAKEFQARYNLTDAEMSQICFVKVPRLFYEKGPKTEYIGRLATDNLELYRKINSLNSLLEEKLENAKTKFFELTSKFNKEDIFDRCKEDCYEDLTCFLFRFEKNSDGVRISFATGTPAEVMQKVWDKADLFLDAICTYYLLQLDEELSEYTSLEICAIIKLFLQGKNQIDFNQSYEGIRSFIINKAKSEGIKTTVRFLIADWNQASIIKG